MKNKKPITVRLNGKKSNKNKRNKNDEPTEFQSVDREQAATVENADEPIPTFARKSDNMNPLNKKSKWGAFKPVVISISAAIFIGSILGFIMLNMFGNINDLSNHGNNPEATNAVAADKDTEKKSNASDEQKAITAYVLQGGVFSEKANADQWAESFKQAGFPAMIWERDDQYYLLTGIADTEEQAKKIAASIKEQNMDVFVKEWQTSPTDTDLNKEEAAWLGVFEKQWQDTLKSVSKQEGILASGWEQLIKEQPENSEKLSGFIEEITTVLPEMEKADENKEQNILLTIWQQYEALL
ncbi:MAG TPA: SPOR domain-containing protein [Virgibacillus sp.]|nr:SPOR domain-containing protein [Virgibacillus sp.]